MNTREIFESFASNQPSAHQKILKYIDETPFHENYWKDWKKLFKLTEEALREVQNWQSPDSQRLLDLMVHFLVRIDRQDILKLKGKFPTKLTMRYMKRRGRRLMWFLAKNAPAEYRVAAEQLILSHEHATPLQAIGMDYKNHWITLDILLGKSQRSKQLGHGQGAYIYENTRYHLHQPEEGMAAVWNQDFDFLRKLLKKSMPWQIHEFAVKILARNQQPIHQLFEQQLVRFFESSSLWLIITAKNYIKTHADKLTFPPHLLAHQWYFDNFKISNSAPKAGFASWVGNFLGIESTKKKWHKRFKKALNTLVVTELKKGNASKRVVRAVNFLQIEGGFMLSPNEVYNLAEVLFKTKSDIMREMAFNVAKSSDTYDAPYWLSAARHSENHLQQLIKVYRKAMENTYRYSWGHREFSGYMFVEHPDVVNFGWELAERYLRVAEVTHIWGRLARSKKDNAKTLLRLNIQAPQAIQWFTVSHSSQMDHLYTYSPEVLSLIIAEGLPPIRDLLLSQITQAFEFNPLMFLYLVSTLTNTYRNDILQKCLPKFAQQNVLTDPESLTDILQRIGEDTWALGALLAIVMQSEATQDEINLFALEMFREKYRAKVLMSELGQLSDSPNKVLFIGALSQNPEELATYSHLIPTDFWVDLLTQMPEEYLNNFKQVFAKVILTLGSEVLDITHPAFDDLLVSWLKHYHKTIDFKTSVLFDVCIHRLPKVRNWGYDHVTQLGLRANFALKLLESEMPETVGFAKAYFSSSTINDGNFVDNLLALCDSPVASTRDFGLDLLKRVEISSKQQTMLLTYLSEHSNDKIQTYVSEKLLQEEQATEKNYVRTFDKAMLRRKNRSKTARENVKKRWSQSTEVDVNTLLELAKTGNQKDSEWAIFELTKLTLQGKEIEGFVLD